MNQYLRSVASVGCHQLQDENHANSLSDGRNTIRKWIWAGRVNWIGLLTGIRRDGSVPERIDTDGGQPPIASPILARRRPGLNPWTAFAEQGVASTKYTNGCPARPFLDPAISMSEDRSRRTNPSSQE